MSILISRIQPGVKVRVRNARGEWVNRMATSGVVDGIDFPVIWVQAEGREPVPWPADEVELPTS